MSRPRKKHRHLPQNVYFSHGAYYHVVANKWHRLGSTLGDALAAYAQRLEPRHRPTTLPDLIDETLCAATERGLATNTLAQYTAVAGKLKHALQEFEAHQLTTPDVVQLLNAFRATPNYANRMRSVLKMALDIAVLRGLLPANPVLPVPRFKERKKDRYVTHAEYQAIYKAASPILRCTMDLCYLTGQRIGDLLALQESQLVAEGIEFDQKKTGKRLLIAWNPALRAAIDAALALRPVQSPYVLALRSGRQRKYEGIKDQYNRAVVAAGVAHTTLHDLRAKSLTDAKKQGLDATALAGHTTQAQTTRYLRAKERDVVQGPSF